MSLKAFISKQKGYFVLGHTVQVQITSLSYRCISFEYPQYKKQQMLLSAHNNAFIRLLDLLMLPPEIDFVLLTKFVTQVSKNLHIFTNRYFLQGKVIYLARGRIKESCDVIFVNIYLIFKKLNIFFFIFLFPISLFFKTFHFLMQYSFVAFH